MLAASWSSGLSRRPVGVGESCTLRKEVRYFDVGVTDTTHEPFRVAKLS